MKLNDRLIHLWQINLVSDEGLEEDYKLLDSEEKSRADRFKFPEHQRRFIKAHAAMRTVLSKYTSISVENIAFNTSENGKPFLPQFPKLQFNLSHSHELAILAITLDVPIGVDVEYQKSKIELLEIAKRFFSKQEYDELTQLALSQQLEGFYNAWTRKEAFVKALGDGLHFGLDKFSVSLSPDMPAIIIEIENDREKAKAWEILSFEPEENYKLAVAIERLSNALEHFNF